MDESMQVDRSPFAPLAAREAGFDPDRLRAAITFAERSESDWPQSLMGDDGRLWINVTMNEPKPWGEPLGPVTPRGATGGLVLRGGGLVASWGDVARVDMTYSVAKSYLAILAGLALGRGIIGSLDERLSERGEDESFASAQNRNITWRHLLQQVSEWEGTLFERPDVVDHNRVVGLKLADAPKGTRRALHPPGTHWEYNDVRVNRLSLSLLQAFGEELPSVLKREVMDPIGASSAWRWDGYRNSRVRLRGRELVSVPGGGHWGGGIVISALDHARVGLLVAGEGVWQGRRLLPAGWVAEMLQPCAINPGYGLMWWLNTDHVQFKAASTSSYFALGAGSHVIWIEPERDLVVVLRWILKTRVEEFIERLLGAMR
jgi:CubicO group peptidase (beta-lactamase class C family)